MNQANTTSSPLPFEPHQHSDQSITTIMWMVVASLTPALGYAVYLFGIPALMLIAGSITAAIIAELLVQIVLRRPLTAHDGSAAITGALIALMMPPNMPIWTGPVTSACVIIIIKQAWGGLGRNLLNPALAARAVLIILAPAGMITDWQRLCGISISTNAALPLSQLPASWFTLITGATPLLAAGAPYAPGFNPVSVDAILRDSYSFDAFASLLWGNRHGCTGEASALLLLFGGIFLLIKKIISWHAILAYGVSCFGFGVIYHLAAGFPLPLHAAGHQLLTGGVLLAIFFMATDPVTSPMTATGRIIFGCGCGALTALVRLVGGFPQGVCYAILVMNLLVPAIDRITRPRALGIGIRANQQP